jgi:hypothetical protein
MSLESIARCDNCKKWRGEGNDFWMGELYYDDVAKRLITVLEHLREEVAKGKKTWCGIPCIQQAIGKELEKDASKPEEEKCQS